MVLIFFLEPNSPNKEKIIRGDFDKALERMKKGYKENSKIQSKAVPLVTQVLILDVCSEKYGGCEYINDNQTETAYDHGGVPFQVNTVL